VHVEAEVAVSLPVFDTRIRSKLKCTVAGVMSCKLVMLCEGLEKGWPNYGPRAASGPPNTLHIFV